MIKSHIFSTFHQKHICLLIWPEHWYPLRLSYRLQCEYGTIKGLNINFIPRKWLLKFIVDDSRYLNLDPVTHIIFLKPETAIRQFSEILHHVALRRIKVADNFLDLLWDIFMFTFFSQLNYILYFSFVILIKAHVVFSCINIRWSKLL